MIEYNFPIIKHLDDVLPSIEGVEEFKLYDKEDYFVINYKVMSNNTFPDIDDIHSKIRRECRGLLFDKQGNILGRRYPKFFNINERQETFIENIDLNKDHIILEKLDGSYCSFHYLNGKIKCFTEMGTTDIAQQIENYFYQHQNYVDLIKFSLNDSLFSNFTFIFEWCSPQNKIVVPYEHNHLFLTGIRHNTTGHILHYDMMVEYAEKFNIEYVPKSSLYEQKGIVNLLDKVKYVDNDKTEGVVIRFSTNGNMIKIKSDLYVRMHNAKEDIFFEKNVLKMILNKTIDDVKPLLSREILDKLNQYQDDIMKGIHNTSLNIISLIDKNQTKKEFAISSLQEIKKINGFYPSIMFDMYDSNDFSNAFVIEKLINIILKYCNSSTQVEQIKPLIGNTVWKL